MHNDVCTSGCDLSGENVIKKVRWYVIFTKEDFVQTLDQSPFDGEDITYDTSAERFAGEKKGAFLERVRNGLIAAPQAWEHNAPHEATVEGGIITHLSGDGRKYVKVSVELLARVSESKPNYDKDQVTAIREVSETLNRLFG